MMQHEAAVRTSVVTVGISPRSSIGKPGMSFGYPLSPPSGSSSSISPPSASSSSLYDDSDHLHLDDTDIEDDGNSRGRALHNRALTLLDGVGNEIPAFQSRFLLILSYTALFGSVLSMSATGPVFVFLQRMGISPILACVWRNQCTCLFLSIPALIEWRNLSHKEKQWQKWRVKGTSSGAAGSQDWHVIWFLCGVAVVWCCSLVLWTNSLPFTTTARASLLTSVYPLLLVLYLKFGPQRVNLSPGEVAGVIVSFLGIAMCEVAELGEHKHTNSLPIPTLTHPLNSLEEHHQHRMQHPLDAGMTFIGDGLCLASAFFIAADIVISKKARQVVPVFIYTLSTCFLTLTLLTILSLLLEDTEFWSRHATRGVFGWTRTEDNMLYLNAGFGMLEGAVGLLGFNFAVKYVPHLVFSSVQLLDPGLTGIISSLMGLESLPSSATIGGILVVSVGIALVVYQQHRREMRERLAGQPQQYQMVQLSDSRSESRETK